MRPRIAARLSQVSRRALGTVLGAAVLLASPSPASAGVEGEMQSFMSDMGVQANVDRPQRLIRASRQVTIRWVRSGRAFRRRTSSPSTSSCPTRGPGAGASTSSPGRSRSSTPPELVAMLKATANNALGFAFKLAIDTISPEIGKVMDELAQKVQQMNQMNISSCETAQALGRRALAQERYGKFGHLRGDRQQSGRGLRLGPRAPAMQQWRPARGPEGRQFRPGHEGTGRDAQQLHLGGARQEIRRVRQPVPRVPDDPGRHR